MRFRFCGNADCPDWVLAEINTLSKLSSIKLKQLGQAVAQGLINPPMDLSKSEKLFSDSKLDSDIDLKACIACISFIITSTVCYNCDHGALFNELQQLGLPREHSMSLKKVVEKNCLPLEAKLKATSLNVNKLENFSASMCSITNTTILDITIDGNTQSVILSPLTVDVLLENLKLIQVKMIKLDSDL